MTVDVEIENRITKCQKILDTNPNSQIFAALAEAFRKKGDLEKAFRVCQNGLRVHPDYGAAHVVMAKINLDRGLYDWAEEEVNRARATDGNNRTVELLLAEIYIYKGEYKSAIKLLKKLAEADPQNEHVRRLLEIAMKIPQEQAVMIGSPVTDQASSTVVVDRREPEPVPVKPPTKLSKADVLRGTFGIDGIQGALFVNTEGLLIASEWQSQIDSATCGAALAEVINFLSQELMKVSFGRVNTVLVETAGIVFYLIHVDQGMYVVVGNAQVNLGTLRMKMAGLVQQVEAR